MGASLFASTGPAGQALSPFPPEEGEDLGERGGAPLQDKRGRGSFRKRILLSFCNKRTRANHQVLFTLILRFSPPQITMPNTTLDKAFATVPKFRDRILLFVKKLRLAQYADGSIYDYRLKIAQAQ